MSGHDKLCPWYSGLDTEATGCFCDLIRQVREQERKASYEKGYSDGYRDRAKERDYSPRLEEQP